MSQPSDHSTQLRQSLNACMRRRRFEEGVACAAVNQAKADPKNVSHLRHRRAAGQAPTSRPVSKLCVAAKSARCDHVATATHQLG